MTICKAVTYTGLKSNCTQKETMFVKFCLLFSEMIPFQRVQNLLLTLNGEGKPKHKNSRVASPEILPFDPLFANLHVCI